jgi:hypothetical protein
MMFKAKLAVLFQDTVAFPSYLLTHPIKGFEDFKRYHRSKNYVAWLFLGLMCLVSILQYLANGFIINPNDPDHFNAYLMILVVIAPVILVTLANWSVTALMDGKGKMGDIFKMICYSFFPLIIISLPLVLISNYITLDEVPFLNVMNLIGVILTGYMMFFGLVGIHEYGVFKTIMTALATIMAMGVIIFICLLFLTLIQQFISFVIAIYKEISFRFF